MAYLKVQLEIADRDDNEVTENYYYMVPTAWQAYSAEDIWCARPEFDNKYGARLFDYSKVNRVPKNAIILEFPKLDKKSLWEIRHNSVCVVKKSGLRQYR